MTISTLNDIAYFINGDRGKNYPSGTDFKQSGIPFINAGDLDDNKILNKDSFKFISKEHFDRLGGAKIQKNDILYCLRGSLGKFAIHNETYNGSIASSLVVLRPKENIYPKYLYYYLDSNTSKRLAKKNDNGSAQPNLSAKSLKTFKIPLPPLKTQKKIASILDNAAALRDKTKQLLKEYDLLGQSIFLEMFGDPGINPKNWKIEEFGTYINVLTDYHANGSYRNLSKNVELSNDKDYALMVRTTDLENNNFESDVKYITKKAYDFLTKSKVFGGEIIINKIGSAGKVYLMPYLDRPVSLGMNAFMLRLKPCMNNLFAFFFLHTKYGEWQINKRVKGAVTKTIRKDAVRAIPIIIPPIKLQNQFAEKIALIEQQKELAKQELQESEDLFNCLLQKAFKGELI